MGNLLVFPGRELGHLDKRRVSSFQQMAFSPAGSFPGFKDTQLFWLLFHSKMHVSILNNLANQMGCFLIPFLKKKIDSNSFQSQSAVKPNCCFTRKDIKLASCSEQTLTTWASMKKKKIIFSDSHCLRLAVTPWSWFFSMSFRATWSSHFLLLCLLPLYPWRKVIMVV